MNSEMIFRDIVIKRVSELRMPESFRKRLVETINNIPSVTIYGYDLEELVMFAHTCRNQNVSIADLKNFCQNTEDAYKAVRDENERILKEVFEQ